MLKRNLIFLSLLLLPCTPPLGGCASPASSAGMVPKSYAVAGQHSGSVHVDVSGGRETAFHDPSQISNEMFAAALVEAIERSRVFTEIVAREKADFLLSVQIFRLQQPVMGFDVRSNFEAGWTLVKRATGTVLWQESLETEFVSTTSDALVFVERSRLAAEGAARQNIRTGIERIAQLDL